MRAVISLRTVEAPMEKVTKAVLRARMTSAMLVLARTVLTAVVSGKAMLEVTNAAPRGAKASSQPICADWTQGSKECKVAASTVAAAFCDGQKNGCLFGEKGCGRKDLY